MLRMKTVVLLVLTAMASVGLAVDAKNQKVGTCILDVAVMDVDGPNYGLDALCRAAKDKVTVVIRCTSGSRYSSQATLNPCLSKGPLVSLQYDAQVPASNVSLLLWLNVPHDVLDSAMYSFTPLQSNVFSAHTVMGDLNYTRFHLAIAQRCISNIKSVPESTSEVDGVTPGDDVTPIDDVMNKKTPPNHRAQIAGVLTERHRRETNPTHLSATPITTPLGNSVPDSSPGSVMNSETLSGATGLPKVETENESEDNNSHSLLPNVRSTGSTFNNLMLTTAGTNSVEPEEVVSSGDGGAETDSYDATTFGTNAITNDVVTDITNDVMSAGDRNSLPAETTNQITAAAAGGRRRLSDADVLKDLLSKARLESAQMSSSAAVSRSPYTPPAPTQRDAAPTQRDAAPTQRDPAPTQRDQAPTQRATASPRVLPSTRSSTSLHYSSSSVSHQQSGSLNPTSTRTTLKSTPTFLRADDLFQDLSKPFRSNNLISPTASSTNPPKPPASPNTDVPTVFAPDEYTDNVIYDGDADEDADSYNVDDDDNFVIEARGLTLDPFEENASDGGAADFEDDMGGNGAIIADEGVTDSAVTFTEDVSGRVSPTTVVEFAVDVDSTHTPKVPSPTVNNEKADGKNDTESSNTTGNTAPSPPEATRRSASTDEPRPRQSSSKPAVQAVATSSAQQESESTFVTSVNTPHPTSSSHSTSVQSTVQTSVTTNSIETPATERMRDGTSSLGSTAESNSNVTSHDNSTSGSSIDGNSNVTSHDNSTSSTISTITTDQENSYVNTTITSPESATVRSENSTTTNNSSTASTSDSSNRTWSEQSSVAPDSRTPTPASDSTTLMLGSQRNSSASELVVPPDEDDIESDTFWPIVAALVIGIPSIIVFGIAITVIHKRRLASPARLRAASMYPSL